MITSRSRGCIWLEQKPQQTAVNHGSQRLGQSQLASTGTLGVDLVPDLTGEVDTGK